MKDRKVNFKKRELATLKNYELCFNKQSSRNPEEGYANLSPEEDTVIEGVLYEINDEDIVKLDRFEGYSNHYDKKTIEVKLKSGKEVYALVYIAQPDKIKEGLKPTKEYLNHLKERQDLISEEYNNSLQSVDTLKASDQDEANNKKE